MMRTTFLLVLLSVLRAGPLYAEVVRFCSNDTTCVFGDKVNVRAGPRSDAPVVGQYLTPGSSGTGSAMSSAMTVPAATSLDTVKRRGGSISPSSVRYEMTSTAEMAGTKRAGSASGQCSGMGRALCAQRIWICRSSDSWRRSRELVAVAIGSARARSCHAHCEDHQ